MLQGSCPTQSDPLFHRIQIKMYQESPLVESRIAAKPLLWQITAGAEGTSSHLRTDLQRSYRDKATDGGLQVIWCGQHTFFFLSAHTELPEHCFVFKLVVNIKTSNVFK